MIGKIVTEHDKWNGLFGAGASVGRKAQYMTRADIDRLRDEAIKVSQEHSKKPRREHEKHWDAGFKEGLTTGDLAPYRNEETPAKKTTEKRTADGKPLPKPKPRKTDAQKTAEIEKILARRIAGRERYARTCLLNHDPRRVCAINCALRRQSAQLQRP